MEQNTVNKHYISAIIQSEKSLKLIRCELRKLSKGIKASDESILEIINNEIINYEWLDDNEFNSATKKVKKMNLKRKNN